MPRSPVLVLGADRDVRSENPHDGRVFTDILADQFVVKQRSVMHHQSAGGPENIQNPEPQVLGGMVTPVA